MNWSARKQGESNGKEEEGAKKVDETLVEHEALIPPSAITMMTMMIMMIMMVEEGDDHRPRRPH